MAPPAAPERRRRRRWILPVAVATVLALIAGVLGWAVWLRPGPGPQDLSAPSVSSTSVSLVWSRPKTGATPERYVIRRDGVEIGRTGAVASYHDAGLKPLTEYKYTVLAVADGKRSRPTAGLVVRTHPASPLALTSSEVTGTSLLLTWSPPFGVAPERYIVRRDGVDLATVPATTLSYRDSSLKPMTDATYTVVAVTKGQLSDPAPSLPVQTLPPPSAEARLQGSWDVTIKVTKAGRTRLKVGDTTLDTWSFTPKCASGACTVDLSGTISGLPFKATLNRSGAVYTGSAKARIARCGSSTGSNTLAVSVKVTGGEMIDAAWAASNWTGSLVLSLPYTTSGNDYCPSQSATFSIVPDSAAQTTT